ncbi:MAG: DUF6055 domain-containing protein [Prevotella sp.]|nr:DUF6055 domain-containing protein [Prevotella sp.]
MGQFEYRCSKLADGNYQVALASCPQSTGFNVIPLQTAPAGTTVPPRSQHLPTVHRVFGINGIEVSGKDADCLSPGIYIMNHKKIMVK